MRLGIDVVIKLVGEDRVGSLLRDLLCFHHVVIRMIRWHRGRSDHDFGTERLEQSDLLLRHLVGHGEDTAVALECCGYGQADAGVAARSLHDRSARTQLTSLFRPLDDRQADPVLHRSPRIGVFSFSIYGGTDAGAEPGQANERCPADGFEDRVVGLEMLRGSHGVGVLGRARGPRNCTG